MRPTLFYGCSFDAHWEYDCPCIVYAPVQLYGIFGNDLGVVNLVEDYCLDLTIDAPRIGKFTEADLKEFKWRGWSPRGFAKRVNAWHQRIRVKWRGDEFEVTECKERFGIRGRWKTDE